MFHVIISENDTFRVRNPFSFEACCLWDFLPERRYNETGAIKYVCAI